MRFKLGESTVRYIDNTHNLSIICIISYFKILLFFEHYYHYIINAIILISLHHTDGPFRFKKKLLFNFILWCVCSVITRGGQVYPVPPLCSLVCRYGLLPLYF